MSTSPSFLSTYRSSYMPYDPRSVSKGGNRGFRDQFGPQPSDGYAYRVVGVDTFDGGDWHRDFKTYKEAMEYFKELTAGKQMQCAYVYNKDGKMVNSGGSY